MAKDRVKDKMKIMFKHSFVFLTGFVAALLLVSVCGENQHIEIPEADAQIKESVDQSRHTAITRAVEMVSPAVVGINVTQVKRYVRKSPFADDPFFRNFFPDIPFEKQVKSLGSGVLISKKGYILTNQHVVADAAEIIVTLAGGTQYKGQKIGEDFTTDLAVLKIDGDDLAYVKLGDSDDVIIGEWVIALGNPFGLFDISSRPTVTVGVVSAIDQDFGRLNDRVFEDMIQTDCAINGGNSGGPLVNCNGEVIGINTWIISGSDYMSASIGLGFAISVNRIKRILNDLINYGRVDRNFWTGITCSELTPLVARYLGLRSTQGAIISELAKNSPAVKAGLEIGDIILAINAKTVTELADIDRIIDELDLKKGDLVTFRIYRNRRYLDVKVKLETNPNAYRGRSQ